MPKSKKVPQLSLFLPTYNEQDVIADTIKKADKVMRSVAQKYEILVINDGSKDDTAKIVKGLIKKNSHIRMVTHNPNQGYGGAVKTGLKQSKYELISFIDSDGQFDYSEITKFLPLAEDHDFVIGYRIARNDPFLRKLNALLWKLWMWFLFGLWVKDIDCAFKVIHKKKLDTLPPLVTHSALTTAELLIRAKYAGLTFAQVGVHHYPRTTGTATGANPKVILKALVESIRLWFTLNFES